MGKFPRNDDVVFAAVQEMYDDAFKRYKGRPLAEVGKGCKKLGIDEPVIWQQISDGIRPMAR